MTVNSHPDRHHARAVYDAVCNNAQVAVGSLPASPVLLDFEAVSARTGFSHARIRSAVDLLVEQQVWHAIRPRKDSGLLCFTQSAGILGQYAYGVKNKALEQFVLSLLRHVPADAFNGWREVDLQKLANQLGLGRQRLEAGLDFLAQRSLLHWRGAQGAFQLRLRFPRTERLAIEDGAVLQNLDRAARRLDQMLLFARTDQCRRHFLLAYLGEDADVECGRCDVCLGAPPALSGP